MAQLDRPADASASQRPAITTISEIRPQDRVTVTGVIGGYAALSISGCPACRYTLADETGEVDLMFLGRVAIAGLDQGRWCSAEGTAALRDDRMVIWNPRYQLHPVDWPGPPADGDDDLGHALLLDADLALGRIQPAR
jgi:hypothetical protein